MTGPAAFMSYVRFDDAHEDGQLSAFRERLAGEIRIQTGREFPIFQDRNDIARGPELAAAHRGDSRLGDASAGDRHTRTVP